MNIKEAVNEYFITNATIETKEKYSWYFKGVVKFYGLKSPEIQKIFKKTWKEIKKLTSQQKIELALEFLSSQYQEDKNFGIMILQRSFKELDKQFLLKLENSIEKNIYDWGSCDSLSGKVICNLLKINPEFSSILHSRKDSKYMWVQRVSCVSFVNIARFGNHNQTIINICNSTIKNPERFVQLGTGWVLRELSLANLELVKKFIKKNYHFFSREGLRYTIEKMTPEDKQYFLEYKI